MKILVSLWLLCGALLWLPPAALAQVDTGAIRVKSNEVLIPVIVLDKKRVTQLHHMALSILWHEICVEQDLDVVERTVVRGLSAGDFRVSQDGQEERIDSVASENHHNPFIGYDRGWASESVGIGGGTWGWLWSAIDGDGGYSCGTGRHSDLLPNLPGYVISYAPPPSPDGSCHKVVVEVDRPKSLVFARSEYCDVGRSLADPLNGTKLGKQLGNDLQPRKRGKLSVSLAAIPLFANSDATRARIVLNYPSRSYTGDCTATPNVVGILGIIYTKDGNTVQRFSDQTSRTTGGSYRYPVGHLLTFLTGGFLEPCRFVAPYRYETQTNLPPGNYEIRVVLSDGEEFGRAEVPLSVDSYDGKHLAISGIVLARRYRQAPGNVIDGPTALPQNYAPLVTKGVIVTPTADTRFRKGDPFCFYFEIFKPQQPGSPQGTVEAHVRIVDAKTGTTVTQVHLVNAASYAVPGSSVIPIGRSIDISSLAKGSYELQAKATGSAGASTPWSSATFTIQ